MDNTRSQTSQNSHGCRSCWTRLRSGKCNAFLLIASAFILWLIIHIVNSHMVEAEQPRTPQGLDTAATEWEYIETDRINKDTAVSEESQNDLYGDNIENKGSGDTSQGQRVFDHTEDEFLRDDKGMDHSSTTESVAMENIDVNGNEHKSNSFEAYDMEKEDNLIKSQTDDNGLDEYDLENEDEAENNIDTELENIVDKPNYFYGMDEKDNKNKTEPLNGNGLDKHSLENKDGLENNTDTDQELKYNESALHEEEGESNRIVLSTGERVDDNVNERLENRNFEEKSNKDEYLINGGNIRDAESVKKEPQPNKTIQIDVLKNYLNFVQESTALEEKPIEDKVHDELFSKRLQSEEEEIDGNAKYREVFDIEAKPLDGHTEFNYDPLISDRINSVDSLHKMVGPDFNSAKDTQNRKARSVKQIDKEHAENKQKPKYLSNYKDIDTADHKLIEDFAKEIFLSQSKETKTFNTDEKLKLEDKNPLKSMQPLRKRRSTVRVLTMPLQQKAE